MMFHIIHIPQPMLFFYFIFWNFSAYEIYFHKIPGFQYIFPNSRSFPGPLDTLLQGWVGDRCGDRSIWTLQYEFKFIIN